MKKVYLSILALFVAMAFLTSAAVAQLVIPTLHMDIDGYPVGTDEITVNVCEYFTFHLWMSDVPDPGLMNWYHDIVLDPLVEVAEVHIKSPFDGMHKVVGDELEMSGYVMTGGVAGEVVPLANITFHCIGVGETDLTQAWHFDIAENFVLANWTAIDTDMLYPNTVAFDPVTIHINQVPIPTALLLLGSGLLGLVGLRRKNR